MFCCALLYDALLMSSQEDDADDVLGDDESSASDGDDAGKGRDDERYCSKHIVNFATAKEAAVVSKGAAREVASAMEAVMAANRTGSWWCWC